MSLKSPSQLKILNDTLDLMTLMTHMHFNIVICKNNIKDVAKVWRFEIYSINLSQIATEYGYDLSLYQPGNEGVVIGDFGEKARLLFEQERISEGHYVELLNLLK